MLNKKVVKKLTSGYNYYTEIKIKSDKVAHSLGIYDEFIKSNLYNLVLNLCNQVIYNYTYVFTKRDLFLISEYNINVCDLIDNFLDDILRQKNLV